MGLDELRANWERFGAEDPYWAVIAAPGREGGGWEADLEHFFGSGRSHVQAILLAVERHGIEIGRRRALDFGCGVGRVTEAFADHFDEVLGIDVAASMIERARSLSRHPDRVRYLVNAAPDLAIVETGSVDLAHSVIVLQHMAPDLMRGYLRELLRVLRPGGVAHLQIPATYQPHVPSTGIAADADRATVEVLAPVSPWKGPPGTRIPVRVRLRNTGSATWTSTVEGDGVVPGAVRVGDHWLDADGTTLVLDDERVPLPHPVAPGEAVVVDLVVTAPAQQGRYVLAVDLVREARHWFSDRGTEVGRVEVRTTGWRPPVPAGLRDRIPAALVDRLPARLRPARPEPAPTDDGPVMEMHALPETAVVLEVEAHGGRVVEIRRDDACGPDWRSWTYLVLKR